MNKQANCDCIVDDCLSKTEADCTDPRASAARSQQALEKSEKEKEKPRVALEDRCDIVQRAE